MLRRAPTPHATRLSAARLTGTHSSKQQYKNLFKRQQWKKNLPKKDWIVLGTVLQKRDREGKETRVALDGQLMDPKRLRTELGRYRADIERYRDVFGSCLLSLGPPGSLPLTPCHQGLRAADSPSGRLHLARPPWLPVVEGVFR